MSTPATIIIGARRPTINKLCCCCGAGGLLALLAAAAAPAPGFLGWLLRRPRRHALPARLASISSTTMLAAMKITRSMMVLLLAATAAVRQLLAAICCVRAPAAAKHLSPVGGGKILTKMRNPKSCRCGGEADG